MLYLDKNSKFTEIKEEKFELERDLQNLVEKNLDKIFGLQYVCSEFQLHGLRIDTLAFDPESKSFVVVEYKRDKSFSVIDQGYAYLALLLNNKADFILEYQQKTKKNIQKQDITREESKVIFVANSFTIHQRQAINFRDLPIELREAKKYNGDIYSFDHIKPGKQTESIKAISSDQQIATVNKEVKTYSVEDHIKANRTKTWEIYEDLKERLLALDGRIVESAVRPYIGYKIGAKVVVLIKPQREKILLELMRVRPSDINDPMKATRELKNAKEFYNKYVTQFDIKSQSDIDYAIRLTEQILKKYF